MVNVPLLRKELEYITAHPEEWNQRTWLTKTSETACGTVGCLAGNTVLHAGYHPIWNTPAYNFVMRGEAPEVAVYIDVPPHDPIYSTTRNLAGMTAISSAAQRLLKLDDIQASLLFDSGNSLRRLWMLAHRFSDGEIEVPLELQDVGL